MFTWDISLHYQTCCSAVRVPNPRVPRTSHSSLFRYQGLAFSRWSSFSYSWLVRNPASAEPRAYSPRSSCKRPENTNNAKIGALHLNLQLWRSPVSLVAKNTTQSAVQPVEGSYIHSFSSLFFSHRSIVAGACHVPHALMASAPRSLSVRVTSF